MPMTPEEDQIVNLEGFGPGTVIGVYEGNEFPVHVLFVTGKAETFTVELFNQLLINYSGEFQP